MRALRGDALALGQLNRGFQTPAPLPCKVDSQLLQTCDRQQVCVTSLSLSLTLKASVQRLRTHALLFLLPNGYKYNEMSLASTWEGAREAP